MTAETVSQIKNKKSPYDELLQRIKTEHQTRAKELIPKLCYTLEKEDPWLSKEDIRDRIKHDLIDIWSRDTIQKNIPEELKNEAKQEAKKKADENRKNVIEESVLTSAQKVLEDENQKKGRKSIDEALHQTVIEQSNSTNRSTEKSLIDPHPPEVAQYRQKFDQQQHDDTLQI